MALFMQESKKEVTKVISLRRKSKKVYSLPNTDISYIYRLADSQVMVTYTSKFYSAALQCGTLVHHRCYISATETSVTNPEVPAFIS